MIATSLKMRLSLIVFTLVVSLIPAIAYAPAPALAAGMDEVVFEGGGFGHGRGMSQYGAEARARAGQGSEEILLSYYTDAPNTAISTLGVDTNPIRNVFANVDSDSEDTIFTVSDGGGTGTVMTFTHVLGGNPLNTVELVAGDWIHIDWRFHNDGTGKNCIVEFSKDGGQTIDDTWDVSICDFEITLQPDLPTATLPEEIITGTNCRTSNCTFGYGGILHIVENDSDKRNKWDCIAFQGGSTPDECAQIFVWPGFDIVVEASLDDYTRGIAEVPYSWEPAAMEAQAIAARSYAASFVEFDNGHLSAGCFCDVKNNTSYQVFAGWVGAKQSWELWDAAAVATNGLVLTHPAAPTSGLIRSEYSSSNGGMTEQGYQYAGFQNPFIYMAPRADPFSQTDINPYATWTVTFPASTIENALSGFGTLDRVDIADATVSGRALSVRFTDTNGNTATKTPKQLKAIISGTATCINDDGNACGGSAFPFPSDFFDVPFEPYLDIGTTVHEDNILYLAALGITVPCDAGADMFCPNDPMEREDIAVFLAEALDLPLVTEDYFVDDDGLPHEADINRLAAARITRGCNPPDNDMFCPGAFVTRGQMAAFLVRAWQLVDPGPGNWFVDDDTSVFEGDIDRLATVGLTKGCNPPANDWYCPGSRVTRGQTATFITRALQNL